MDNDITIILINSPLFNKKSQKYEKEDYLPPLGLGYLATHLSQNNVTCKLIDAVAYNLVVDEIILEIEKHKPNYVGINVFTSNLDLIQELINKIKINTHIIIGGNATQFVYATIFKNPTLNNITAIIGDGEKILLDLILETLEEKPIYRSQNRRVYKVSKDSIYFPFNINQFSLDRSFFKNEPYSNYTELLEATIITSRGCIYNCAFCGAAKKLNEHSPSREREIDNIKEELLELITMNPNLQSIRVLDDLFLKNNESIHKAAKLFSSIEHLKWRGMAHTMSFLKCEQKDLIALKNSGCYELSIGIESGSKKILNMIHKVGDLNKIYKTFEMIFNAGIAVKGYFIFGFPNENESDAEETYQLAKKLKELSIKEGSSFRTSVFQFRPYHGTELYNYLNNNNLLLENLSEDENLNTKLGHSQFNFTSGNYSNIPDKRLLEFIENTKKLNNKF